jgi:hypothetical protein
MICLRTTDDWTTATITLDDGGGPQVFTPTSAVKDARAAAVEFAAFLTATYAVTPTIEYLRLATTGATIRIIAGAPFAIAYNAAGLALFGGTDTTDDAFDWAAPSGAVAGVFSQFSDESRIHLSQPVKTTPGVRPAASVGCYLRAAAWHVAEPRARHVIGWRHRRGAATKRAGSGGESAHRRRLRCQ